jgi:hypothetical protein
VLDCLAGGLAAWWPLLVAVGLLQVLRALVLRPRLARIGSPVPGLASLRVLLDADGQLRGVPVREELDGRYGGGRFVRWSDGAEIRLIAGTLDRADVDALVVLEHERGHAEGDLPMPRAYRMAVLGAFLLGLAIALGQPRLVEFGTLLMWAAYAFAFGHVLRDEGAASTYALDQLDRWKPPFGLWLEGLLRLGVGFGLHLADWGAIAVGVLLLTEVAGCR